EGRLAFWHTFNDNHRLEVAPGFHISTTHVGGLSAKSRLASLDWKMTPWWKLEFSGTAFHGQNAAGLGALGNGFALLPNRSVRSVDSSGGWAQLSLPVTSRLKFNLFSGFESDGAKDLPGNPLIHDFTYASNLMYHLGPNVVVSFEALQTRARFLSGTNEKHNH